MVTRLSAIFLLLALCSTGPARAEDTHYMVLFGAQNRLFAKPRAHCFVTFIKIPGPAPGPDAGSDPSEAAPARIDTISWYPHGERCRLFRKPEPGRNAGLEATLDRCRRSGMAVCRWGPYQIEPELYQRGIEQKCRLESGEVLWQAIDKRSRRARVAINCVHAVSDVDEGRGLLEFGPASGKWASAQIACHLEPWIIDSSQTHDWVLELLDLGGYPIEPRAIEPAALRYAPAPAPAPTGQ